MAMYFVYGHSKALMLQLREFSKIFLQFYNALLYYITTLLVGVSTGANSTSALELLKNPIILGTTLGVGCGVWRGKTLKELFFLLFSTEQKQTGTA